MRKQSTGRSGNKWWTEKLTHMRRLVKNMRRRYQRCQNINRDLKREEYLIIKNKYKQQLNEAKQKCWNEFVTNSTSENPWGLVYKIAKNKLNNEKITELKIRDKIITDNKQIANELFSTFFPTDDSIPELNVHQNMRQKLNNLKLEMRNNSNNNEVEFTVEEVSDTVRKQNKNKAPGNDCLTADIIQFIHNIDPTLLTNIYNKCLKLETFLNMWKHSIVKVIPKQLKMDYRDPNAYRPISLLPVLAKIFEKLIIDRIVHYLRKNNLINDNQYGFTPQRSTETALHSLKNFVNESLNKKGFALVISLDISGAFNYCWWPKIFYQFRVKKVPNNICNLIESYFSDRYASLWYLNLETKRRIDIGCPQGSSSGPWFWNLCYDDIFDLTDSNARISGYADDTLVMVYADDAFQLQDIANDKLRQISEWGAANKLKFNIEKTKCALFTRRLKYDKPKIEFEGKVIELSNSFKYLGLIIDNKLSWREHINSMKAKVAQVLNSLLRYAKQHYGLNRKAIETIYKGSIIPMITYGCSVWADVVDHKYIIEPLASLQRQVALRIIRGYRTISTDAANVIANLIPIDLTIKARAVEYYIKHNIECELTEKYLSGTNIKLENIQRSIDIRKLRHRSQRKQIKVESDICEHNIFAAGVKTADGVGAAFSISRHNRIIEQKKYKLDRKCSSFQAELFAIYNAIKHINEMQIIDRITIKPQTKSVFTAMKDPNSTTQLVFQIYEQFFSADSIGILIQISLTIDENQRELVNRTKELSKEASRSHNRISFELVPNCYVKRIIREKNVEIWNQRWISSSNGPTTKLFIVNIYERLSMKKYFETDFYLTQAISGHGKLNAYLNRFHIIDTENCSYCTDRRDDIEHRLYECAHYEESRNEFIQAIEGGTENWPIRTEDMISNVNFTAFKELCYKMFI